MSQIIFLGLSVPVKSPAHSVNSYSTFGVAVSSTIVPSIYCPLAGVIVPPVIGLADVVSVYLITGFTKTAVIVLELSQIIF